MKKVILSALTALSVSVYGQEVGYKTIKFGKNNQFVLQLRAMVQGDPNKHYLEMNTCLPVNRWFGVGFGQKMADSELIFFMAPPA